MAATSTCWSSTRGRALRHTQAAEHAAAALFRLCNGSTPAEGIVRIDASLRPEGKPGPIARSLDAFERYHQRWGQTWERQALLRAPGRLPETTNVVKAFVAPRGPGPVVVAPGRGSGAGDTGE